TLLSSTVMYSGAAPVAGAWSSVSASWISTTTDGGGGCAIAAELVNSGAVARAATTWLSNGAGPAPSTWGGALGAKRPGGSMADVWSGCPSRTHPLPTP